MPKCPRRNLHDAQISGQSRFWRFFGTALYVIVGGGTAGGYAAREFVRLGCPKGSVLMISDLLCLLTAFRRKHLLSTFLRRFSTFSGSFLTFSQVFRSFWTFGAVRTRLDTMHNHASQMHSEAFRRTSGVFRKFTQ